jgi:hypothetical protein
MAFCSYNLAITSMIGVRQDTMIVFVDDSGKKNSPISSQTIDKGIEQILVINNGSVDMDKLVILVNSLAMARLRFFIESSRCWIRVRTRKSAEKRTGQDRHQGKLEPQASVLEEQSQTSSYPNSPLQGNRFEVKQTR